MTSAWELLLHALSSSLVRFSAQCVLHSRGWQCRRHPPPADAVDPSVHPSHLRHNDDTKRSEAMAAQSRAALDLASDDTVSNTGGARPTLKRSRGLWRLVLVAAAAVVPVIETKSSVRPDFAHRTLRTPPYSNAPRDELTKHHTSTAATMQRVSCFVGSAAVGDLKTTPSKRSCFCDVSASSPRTR